MSDLYPEESLDGFDDDGTMVSSKEALAEAVVGHRIVKAERIPREVGTYYTYSVETFVITLDNGKEVRMVEQSDCCAYTDIESFLLNPELVDHMILGVGTTDGYTTWHIYADMGDVLKLDVSWSAGNPFYYAYGFNIAVEDIPKESTDGAN
jgi:hypothetical protein